MRTEGGPCYGPSCDHISHRPAGLSGVDSVSLQPGALLAMIRDLQRRVADLEARVRELTP